MKRLAFTLLCAGILFILASFISARKVSAHCDTLDGRVVSAARKALKTENASYVLI